MKKILFAALFTIVVGGSVSRADAPYGYVTPHEALHLDMQARHAAVHRDLQQQRAYGVPQYVRHEEHRAAKRALNCEWKSGHRAVRASRGAAQYSRSPAGVVAFRPAPPAPTW
jgi:hypothetical protein